jgi:hypothetical protein
MSIKVIVIPCFLLVFGAVLPVAAEQTPQPVEIVSPTNSDSAAIDLTAATITRIDQVAKQIGELANGLDLTPKEDRALRFNGSSPALYEAIESLKVEVAANHLTGTLYENIVFSQCPSALEEIKGLYLKAD